MPAGFTGHVRHPNKDHLIDLSHRRHRRVLQGLYAVPTPPSWDSRSQGWVTPIKDQGQCGSCWDFSGVGVVEVAYAKAGIKTPSGQPIILSEQYVLSCQRNGGCGGDDNVTVLDIAKGTGLPLTADYGPYQGQARSCTFKPAMTLFKVDDWGFADSNGGNGVTPTQDIKNAIMQYGCVGSAVAAGGDSFWDSGTGIGTGGSHNIDHDVILVGWSDTGTTVTAAVGSGVTLPTSSTPTGWWWMRNSWNTSWGQNGYAQIAYGAYDIGTEAVWAKLNASSPPIDWALI